MSNHRKANSNSNSSASLSSSGYHNPAITNLPQTSAPQQILAHSAPELVEAALVLYDSHYSDEQFDEVRMQPHTTPCTSKQCYRNATVTDAARSCVVYARRRRSTSSVRTWSSWTPACTSTTAST